MTCFVSPSIGSAGMGLDLVGLPWRRPLRLASLDRARDGGQRAGDGGTDLAGERQQPRGDVLQDAQREGVVARPVARSRTEHRSLAAAHPHGGLDLRRVQQGRRAGRDLVM